MTLGRDVGAGRALRVSPRAGTIPALALALTLAVALGAAACAGRGASGAGASGAGPRSAGEGSGSVAGGGSVGDAALALVPDRIGNLELEVIAYPVPDALDVVGGPQLAAMLATLDLTPADVSLVMAVDRASLLAIGRWGLPGSDADAILAAWVAAAGTGWHSDALAGETALAGVGPDGRRAWAVARQAAFVYVVTDDPHLAEQAISATR